MEVILVLLGAFCALVGGLITTAMTRYLDRIDEERATFYEVNELLLKYNIRDSADSEENIRLRDDISKLALKIRSNKHLNTAVKLSQFCLDKKQTTIDEFSELLKEVQENINSKMVIAYNKANKTKSIVRRS